MGKNNELAQTLLSAKFCWDNGEFLADEFWGSGDMMGFYDHVRDYIEKVNKASYINGFLAACPPTEVEEEKLTNKHNAEKSWDYYSRL